MLAMNVDVQPNSHGQLFDSTLDYHVVCLIQSEHSFFASARVLTQNHKMANANDNNYASAILFTDIKFRHKIKKTEECFKSGRFRLPRGGTGDGCQKREPPAQTRRPGLAMVLLNFLAYCYQFFRTDRIVP